MKDDDESLFSQEMADVTPLPPKRAVVYLKSSNSEKKQLLEEVQLAAENTLTVGFLDVINLETSLDYKDPGVQIGVLEKLRKGKYTPNASLNLLRQPVEVCRQALFAFYCQAQEEQWRTLLIIHGRGREENSHPNIIRSYVAKWLKQLDQVQAFCVAQRHDGGEGACYVILKKSADARQENWERHAKHSR